MQTSLSETDLLTVFHQARAAFVLTHEIVGRRCHQKDAGAVEAANQHLVARDDSGGAAWRGYSRPSCARLHRFTGVFRSQGGGVSTKVVQVVRRSGL